MNRRLRALTVASGLAAGFVGGSVSGRLLVVHTAAAQAEHPKVVAAEKFSLVDSYGREQGAWGVLAGGTVALALGGQKGKPGVALAATPEGGAAVGLID